MPRKLKATRHWLRFGWLTIGDNKPFRFWRYTQAATAKEAESLIESQARATFSFLTTWTWEGPARDMGQAWEGGKGRDELPESIAKAAREWVETGRIA